MQPNRLLFFLLLITYTEVTAQQNISLSFDKFNQVKDLATQSVNGMVQDNKGFIWLGTSEGLIRFDGNDIKTFKSSLKDKNSLTDSNIRALAKDNGGNLWIATQGGGLDQYNPIEEKFFHHRSNAKDAATISGNAVWSVLVDKKNRVWAGTWSDGLNYYSSSDKKFKRISGTTDPIMAIAEDEQGNIWYGGDGLNKIVPESGERKTYPLKISEEETSKAGIRGILVDNGLIWMATDNDGIFVFDPSTQQFKRITHSNAALNQVYALHAHRGKIFAATNGGLITIENFEIRSIHPHNPNDPLSLSTDAARSIIHDVQGGLWIGCEGGGVNRILERKSFKTFRNDPANSNTISYNLIRSIYDDRSGRIWVGTQGGGLNVYDPVNNIWTLAGTGKRGDFTLSSNQVSSIFQDADGIMWIGTWGGGLNKVNLETGSTVVYKHNPEDKNSIPDDRLQVTYVDKQGGFWVGTENGLALFNPTTEKWTHFRHNEQDPTSIVGNNIQGQAFAETEDGSLWIGTWFGLNRLTTDRQSFARYTSDSTQTHPLSNDHIISLHADKLGNLWIGTFGGGLNHLHVKTGEVIQFSEQDGLPSNTIFGIREDGSGNLWMSTSKGLSRFNPKTKSFRNYDVSEGLQSNEFYWGAAHMARDSSLLFGGINGLNWFKPSEIKDNTELPPVVLTDFQIFNKSIAVGQNSILKQGINYSKSIELRYDQAVINFQFAALNFNNSEKNQFAYKLENFDPDWNYVGNKRNATYTNLDPGEYTLRIKASNNDNVWNNEGVALTIVITPPFWKTWWFYSLLTVAVVGFVYGIVKIRIRELKKDKERMRLALEASLEKAQQELEQQKQAMEQEKIANKERNWTDQSLAKFGDLLSKGKNDVRALCASLLKEIVYHLEIAGGAIYVFDAKSETLIPEANFGFDKVKSFDKDEGMVGACFTQRERQVIKQVPDEYFKISSGLGKSLPQSIILIPIKFEEVCLGVIELACFEPLEEYKIKLVELLAERLTTTMNTTLLAQNTQRLLDETRTQAEELKVREEELRQNLEELQAINEDRDRKTKDLEDQLESLKRQKT